MIRVLARFVVDRGFEPQLSQTKEYEIGVCWFSAKNAELRRKSKDLLASKTGFGQVKIMKEFV
jgi:hypothetical protein